MVNRLYFGEYFAHFQEKLNILIDSCPLNQQAFSNDFNKKQNGHTASRIYFSHRKFNY